MNVLFISVDSLRLDYLPMYERSADIDIAAPNLESFAERALTFDTHYAGSLPCMPARREWLTGTQGFLWRPWGPVEPFDTTIPFAARNAGVLSQLVTDHYHYFQHGSTGYYEDFSGFQFHRGHEYDAWQTTPAEPDGWLLSQVLDTEPKDVDDPALGEFTAGDDPTDLRFMNRAQYARNAAQFTDVSDFFAPRVFSGTADWIEQNDEWDQWFCYVDSFDVHEPFHNPEPYASMYTDEDPRDPAQTIWPFYGRTDEGQSELSERELEFVKSQFAGSITMVDEWFGEVLEALDETDAWDETMVVVTSDHGFFLGDHGWIGKPGTAPMYDTLARTPLLVWHPDSDRMGERTATLTSAVDLYATILDALGISVPSRTHSRSLMPVIHGDAESVREWALYGYWGSSVNLTDGQYTYLHPCRSDVPSVCFSTRQMNAHDWFVPESVKQSPESGQWLPYTDASVWRYEAPSIQRNEKPLLFNSRDDPEQATNLAGSDAALEREMRTKLVGALEELNAPNQQYERLGLGE
jgi:arylsulfatase A-like enzyme